MEIAEIHIDLKVTFAAERRFGGAADEHRSKAKFEREHNLDKTVEFVSIAGSR